MASPCSYLPLVTNDNLVESKAKFEAALSQIATIYEKIKWTRVRIRRVKDKTNVQQLAFHTSLRLRLRCFLRALLHFKRYAKYYALSIDHVEHVVQEVNV